MKTTKTYASLLVLAAAVILLVGACGGGSDSDAGGSTSSAGPTVSSEMVDGVGRVLVDSQGAALYAADQEAGGKVLCTDSCTSIWEPLTVSGMPTSGDGLDGKLGVVTRADGSRQVTFDGRLLYRFTEDPDAGTVTGNGFADSFDGQAFVWHVATPTGVSTSNANSSSSSDDDGGYGY